MPQGSFQILKRATSCRSASKPSHDDIPPPGREGTPRPARSRPSARQPFSIPASPPIAFCSRRVQKAMQRLDSSKNAEPRKPNSRTTVIMGKNRGPSSPSTPFPAAITSTRKQSISADDVDAADDTHFAEVFSLLILIDEANLPSPRAKEESYHNDDFVPEGPQPIDVDQTINNVVRQLNDVYEVEENRTLKHKNKQVPLRSKPFDEDDETELPAYSARNRHRWVSTPTDLTLGILGPPAYKPPNQHVEGLGLSDPSLGRAKEDKSTLRTAFKEHLPCPPPTTPAYTSSTLENSTPSSPCQPRCQPRLPPSNVCTSRMCPVLGFHFLGLYLHNNAFRTRPEIYFGDSNPPPMVWYAVDLMAKGKANQTDEEIIAEFIRLHHYVFQKTG